MLANAVLSWCMTPSPAKQSTLLGVTVPLQKSKLYAALLAFLLPLDSAQAGQQDAHVLGAQLTAAKVLVTWIQCCLSLNCIFSHNLCLLP
jgi:hypothetical protein